VNPHYLEQAILVDELPLAFPGRARVTARLKEHPEDFQVEEINNFVPTGDGHHLFLWVEKRDCSGGDLLRRLAAALDIPQAVIGTAGTKDRRAVTRQWLSVPDTCLGAVEAGVELEGIIVLNHTLHQKKLRLGHLAGNRFRILLRGAEADHLDDLSETGRLLASTGFPNFYGQQRFGAAGQSLAQGLALLENDGRPDHRMSRFQRRMAVSALQSALFNRYLLERMEAGLAFRVLQGDVMTKSDTGGLFKVGDVDTEQPRLDSGETRITGPMYGHKFMAAEGEAGELEGGVLDRAGLTTASFKVFARLARGTRRPLLVCPGDVEVAPDPHGLVVSFSLPRGTYATVMLREIICPSKAPVRNQ